ncbi:MAG: PQQ-binding-like beta-propeller repeat protein, partial [Candidatus Firestonebacteria bacterium]
MKQLLLLLTLFSAAYGADWPQFRGNDALTGVSTEAIGEKPSLLWAYETKEKIQTQAAIAGNTAFISAEKKIFALELSSGKLLWKFEKPDWQPSPSGSIKSSPLVSGGALYFGTASGKFYALDSSSGRLKWSFDAESNIVTSPIQKDDKVLFGTYAGNLYSLNKADGKSAWMLEFGIPIYASP